MTARFTSSAHNSKEGNVKMLLSKSRKLATFAISLDRTDVKSAVIVHKEEVLADITSDFVANSGIANGVWTLSEPHGNLLKAGRLSVVIVFNDGTMKRLKVSS